MTIELSDVDLIALLGGDGDNRSVQYTEAEPGSQSGHPGLVGEVAMEFMDLFRPKWKHSNWRVRLATVRVLTDQNILGQVARGDSDGHVRVAAAEKLVDHVLAQAAYAEVAKTSGEDLDVRLAAIRRLVDQTALAEIAESDTFWSLRLAAAEQLTDAAAAQVVYAEEARTNSDRDVRWAALARLTDQTALADVAKAAKYDEVRRAAVRRLTDQTLLADIANTDRDREIRRAAAGRLTDQTALARVAKNDANAYVRKVAVENLTGQGLLAEIAKTDESSTVRGAAAGKLTDQTMLADIAKTDRDSDVRKAAADKLTDQTVLADVAKTADRTHVRVPPVKPPESSRTEKTPSLGDKVEAAMAFLNSDSFRQEIERAKRARDEASVEDWKRQGSQGLGQPHSCHMCHNTTYGEQTVIRLQKEALAQNNILEALRIEERSGYRCKSCGKEFCKDCLEKKAPSNAFGGKSCPGCNGLFEIIHG